VVREDTNHGCCDDPNDGSEMWFVKTRTMAAITIQPRWRNVVREDTNHELLSRSNHGGEMWFVKTRTMAAVKTRTMAAVKTRTMAAVDVVRSLTGSA
jgi:hypothetical protein